MKSKHLIIAISTTLATIAAIITIIVFITGKQSIKEFEIIPTASTISEYNTTETIKEIGKTETVAEETIAHERFQIADTFNFFDDFNNAGIFKSTNFSYFSIGNSQAIMNTPIVTSNSMYRNIDPINGDIEFVIKIKLEKERSQYEIGLSSNEPNTFRNVIMDDGKILAWPKFDNAVTIWGSYDGSIYSFMGYFYKNNKNISDLPFHDYAKYTQYVTFQSNENYCIIKLTAKSNLLKIMVYDETGTNLSGQQEISISNLSLSNLSYFFISDMYPNDWAGKATVDYVGVNYNK